jgi:hypothetical protein
MQPSGGGGGGGGSPFPSSQHPGIAQKKDKRRSDEGPGTVFEFVQGFTPMPNPVARTILSDTSLSPEQQQIHANLMGLRNGGSVGFRPLVPGYAEAGLVDLGAISTADTPRTATPEEMEDARRIETMEFLKFYLGEAEGREDLPPYWKSLSAETLNGLFREWQKDPEAARKTWERISTEMREMKDGADAGGAGIMAPMAEDISSLGRRLGDSIPVEDWDQAREGQRAVGDQRYSNYDLDMLRKIQDLTFPSSVEGFVEEPIGNTGRLMGLTPLGTRGVPTDTTEPLAGYPGLRSGGPVEQKYAHGGYTSHGTVAGELPRYGNMSVREEGEDMRELAKRHKEQDWYNRMRQSPTLGKVRIA